MSVIHVLDKSVYELIAAGEVIDRPASVVKELVENSIDAGATKITVEIKNGGKTYMRITDNGCGISPEDVPLAFIRHATSKICQKEDLESIATLGFRGEALASVCAVAKVELMTKQKGAELGYHYAIEESIEKESEYLGCPDGTTFIIRDIFYNVPVRQRFMKKDVTEGNAIAATLQKLALSHPEVSLRFIRDNRTEFFTYGDGKLLSCIYTIFGKEFYNSCIPVEYSQLGIKVSGYITKPLMSKANRAYQNFFVNSRYVKSLTCMTAVEEGYSGRIMVGKFPGCVIKIELAADSIDVNTHPAKLEIKFRDEKSVYNTVFFAVKNALMMHDSAMDISLAGDESEGKPILLVENKLTKKEIFEPAPEKIEDNQLVFRSSIEDTAAWQPSSSYKWESSEKEEEKPSGIPSLKLLDEELSGETFSGCEQIAERSTVSAVSYTDIRQKTDDPAVLADTVETKEVSDNTPEAVFKSDDDICEEAQIKQRMPHIRVIGEAFKTYIVAECGENVLLVDKHAAHERYIYEQIKSRQGELDMQLLVCPIKASLPYEIYDAVAADTEACRRLGIGIKVLEPPCVEISGIPSIAGDTDPVELITGVGDCLLNNKDNGGMEIFDDLFHSMACKAAIKANSNTSCMELERLLKTVTEEDLRYCPHGRPILIRLSKSEIEKMFKRIV